MFNLTKIQKTRFISLLFAAMGMAAPGVALAATYTIDTEYAPQLEIGTPEVRATESVVIDVTTAGSIIITSPEEKNPNPIRAYLGGNAGFTLNNDGLLDGRWGVFAYADGSGDVTVNNYGEGVYTGEDYALYLISNTGNVYVNNQSVMSSSGTELSSEEYHSTVVMQSTGGANLTLDNSGHIDGKWLNASVASQAAVITADTSGMIHINNHGSIQGVGGSELTDQPAGTGIYVTSDVSGGLIKNSGLISAATAIDVQGHNVRVELHDGGKIIGDVIFSGANNTLAIAAQGQEIGGNVILGQNNNLEFSFMGADPSNPLLSVAGAIDIIGSNLNLDINGISIGQAYELLHGSSINGWFETINLINEASVVSSVVTGGNFEEGVIYDLGDYQVMFSFSADGSSLFMTVVPEPSAWAAIVGAVALGGVLLRRRMGKAN